MQMHTLCNLLNAHAIDQQADHHPHGTAGPNQQNPSGQHGKRQGMLRLVPQVKYKQLLVLSSCASTGTVAMARTSQNKYSAV